MFSKILGFYFCLLGKGSACRHFFKRTFSENCVFLKEVEERSLGRSLYGGTGILEASSCFVLTFA